MSDQKKKKKTSAYTRGCWQHKFTCLISLSINVLSTKVSRLHACPGDNACHLRVFHFSTHSPQHTRRPKHEAPLKEVKQRQKSRIDVATQMWLCYIWIGLPMCSQLLENSGDLQTSLSHWKKLVAKDPDISRQRYKQMAICCEEADSNGMLIALVIALVVAMLIFVTCQPYPHRRITIYRCYRIKCRISSFVRQESRPFYYS
ncbi:uncharacterized protein J3R85_006170 [Psidium guajava]|nr:uncharacterized protein J3R85_006170 [Psidium guajava]